MISNSKTGSILEARIASWPGGLLLGLLAGLLYGWLGPAQYDTSSFPPLAAAFLHGQDWLSAARPWNELALRAAGGFYVPMPPGPALALMPFVWRFGLGAVTDINWVTALFGGLAVWQTYGLLRDLGVRVRDTLVLTLFFAFGSEFLYAAATSGHALLPMVLAVLALTAALRLGVQRRWPLVAGLLLTFAITNRLPVVFALPLLVYLYARDLEPWQTRATHLLRIIARWALLALPLIVGAILIGLYNFNRFGSPLDFGYALIISGDDQKVRCAMACRYPTTEPWFAAGIESISYIPRSLSYMLTSGFHIINSFPYLKPSWTGLSLLLVMPSLLWLALAPWRTRLAQVAGLSLALIMLVDLCHGSWGFAQVGYRFILDGLPVAVLLLGLMVARRGLRWPFLVAMGFGGLVIWYITVASWVGFIAY